MYKGEAILELTNTETGEKQIYDEHNTLSCLLDDLFNENQFDGVIKHNFELKKYFNKLCLFDGTISKNSDVIDDNVNIIACKEATTTNKYDEDGLELVFKFSEDEAVGQIDCLSLVPESFENFTEHRWYKNDLLSGSYTVKSNIKSDYKLINIDFDNNWCWSLETQGFDTYKQGEPFYIYLRKYYHNFSIIPLSNYDEMNMKLLETTEIDISDILKDVGGFSSYDYINFAVDEDNNRIIIYALSSYRKILRTCVFSIDNTADVAFYDMTIPNDVNLKISYSYWGKLTQTLCYKGKLLFMAEVNKEDEDIIEYVGINPVNSTDYDEYDIIFIDGTRNEDCENEALMNLGNGTAIGTHLMVKNDVAYVIPRYDSYPTGFFYKSKYIQITANGSELKFDYYLAADIVSTINELSKTIYKSDKQTLKITYRITQAKEGQ